MSNVLQRNKQIMVISALVEGASVRAAERMTDVSRPTVLSLLVRVGMGCMILLDRMMRGLDGTRWELDEQWDFVHCKQRQVREHHDASRVGDVWTYVALDADSKLVPCFRVGKRDGENTFAFLSDLESRLANRVQISTDGLRMYADMIPAIFGGKVDFATVVKSYEADADANGRYSPPKVSSVEKTPICGAPVAAHVTTSHVESFNQKTRANMKRMARLSNAHSKKLENHVAATALHFAHYNLCRIHASLRVTPAMAADVSDHVWSIDELIEAALAAFEDTQVSK